MHVHKSTLLIGIIAATILSTGVAANYHLDFGGDFTLTDPNGQPFSLRDARGMVVIIYFGFTSCASVCPTTMARISTAMKQLGPMSQSVQPLFISVDTKRDTPEVLRQYAAYFNPSLIALTGTQEEVEAVASQYRTPVLVRKPKADGYYAVDHGSRLFLVDRDGGLANILRFEDSAEKIARHVKELLDQ